MRNGIEGSVNPFTIGLYLYKVPCGCFTQKGNIQRSLIVCVLEVL